MTGKRNLTFAWKLLIFLTLINYQVVVILCNDFILLKFLRDLVLIYILLHTLSNKPGIIKVYLPAILALLLFMVLACFRTDGLSALFVNARKYVFPLGVLIAARTFPSMDEDDFQGMLDFLSNLLAILAVWGIFQALVLKDTFLIDMGYPTIYSYAYKRITLNYSYYFGNLGIQRVTATLSNSNVFGIILGITIIALLLNHKKSLVRPTHWLRLMCIALGYVLTVSRSNFLAMIIVALILFWRHIPHKDKLFGAAAILMAAFVAVYFIQDGSGITHKLVDWVVKSLTLTESSAAGRNDFWSIALEKVLQNPFGIGFGKTGAQAIGAAEVYFCENSYLAMALDMGWLGCASYVLLELSIIYDVYSISAASEQRARKKMAITLIVYFMIVSFFSNHIYDMEAVSLVYFLVGITANQLFASQMEAAHTDNTGTPRLEESI